MGGGVMSPVALRYLHNKEKERMWERGCSRTVSTFIQCQYIYIYFYLSMIGFTRLG